MSLLFAAMGASWTSKLSSVKRDDSRVSRMSYLHAHNICQDRSMLDAMDRFNMRLFIMIALAATTFPASAIYQCKDANGRTSFQDTPCASGAGKQLQVRPASGGSDSTSQPRPAPSSTSGTQASSSHDPVAKVRQLERTNEISRIDREIRDIEYEIEKDQLEMERELTSLQQKKARANNNLAGATWEQSISTEMQAVTEKYRAKFDYSRDRISGLRVKREAILAAE